MVIFLVIGAIVFVIAAYVYLNRDSFNSPNIPCINDFDCAPKKCNTTSKTCES